MNMIVSLCFVFSLLLQQPRIPGQSLDLITLYRSSKLTNDMIIDSVEQSPQQESGDASKKRE